MLRKETKFWESIVFVLDCVLLALVWLGTYLLRFSGWPFPVTQGVPPLGEYLQAMLFIPVVWAVVFRSMRLYRPRRLRSYTQETFDILKASILGTFGLLGMAYLVFKLDVSRVFLALYCLLSALSLISLRLVFREALRFFRRRGRNLRHALILGTDELGFEIQRRLRLHPELGINVLGFISTDDADIGREIEGTPVIGNLQDLRTRVHNDGLDLLLVAVSSEVQPHLESLLSELKNEVLDINLVSSLYKFAMHQGSVEEFEGLPIISVTESPMVGWNRVAKRAFDLAVGLIMLTLSLPLQLLIALVIKLTDKGPIFYRQERMGLDGRRFKLIKFRTMPVDAERDGAVWSNKNDTRAKGFGAFLRWTSLDEIPQLWNIVRGEMSLVGPRPERPVFVQEFRKQLPRYMQRHKVKAGLTGWAQINGFRGDTSIQKRLQCDLFYIEHWSMMLDLKILWRTLCGGFLDRAR